MKSTDDITDDPLDNLLEVHLKIKDDMDIIFLYAQKQAIQI